MAERASDTVHLYLTEMGRVKLLTGSQERSIGRRISESRTRYRRRLLATDLALQAAADTLERICSGQVRIERTLDSPAGSISVRRRLMSMMRANLPTIQHLIASNQADFRTSVDRRRGWSARFAACRRIIARRRKAMTLIEETPLKRPILEDVRKQLKQIAKRMESLRTELDRADTGGASNPGRVQLRRELQYLVNMNNVIIFSVKQ